jgi:hypothetical protein
MLTGRQEEYAFNWGKSIDMKLVNVKDDDGKIKPLVGDIISQYIRSIQNNKLVPGTG